ncbi:MAG: fibronectin type III domain-containing protein, partial [Methylocella sp.]
MYATGQNMYSKQGDPAFKFSGSRGGPVRTKTALFKPLFFAIIFVGLFLTIASAAHAKNPHRVTDTTAPSIPANLSASAASSSQINLSWSASTDNVGVAGYKVYRNNAQIATTTGTSYSNSGLSASTTYSFAVAAYDAAGNTSAPSNTVSATTQAGQVTSRMGQLPRHFGIWLRSPQNELSWMTGSGVPWEYRYQYITPGWKTWNSPSGKVVSNYTTDSVNNGYIPVFTWYQLSGMYYTGTWVNWPDELKSPTTMNSYYGDFALLMQKIAATGTTKPVFVHVEPDLWGFMQQYYGGDPAVIPVSVASSGFAGLSGFANNASGFAQALLAIRNAYAPNVILAW